MIDPDRTFQSIEGFGGAFTDAAADVFAQLPAASQEQFLKACFDPVEGNGYNLCRTTIHSCDYAASMYTYDDVPGDKELAHFSIEHDRVNRLPFIKRAQAAAKGQTALLRLTVEPAGLDEDQRRHEARRKAQARVPADLGRLLREVREGLRRRGHPDLGADRPERGPRHAGVGVVHLHGQRGAGLRARPPRAHPPQAGAGGREADDLGPQPRPRVPARGGRLQRPAGFTVHLGHGLPLVRRRSS